ncbi:MAG TPA: hypothetical protein VGO87_05005 [Acidimicrobiia bacterium]
MKRRIVATVIALLGLGVGVTPASAADGPGPPGTATSTVGGSWAQIVNCVFTDYDPSSGAFHCVGSSTWEGSWTGVTHYAVTGVFNATNGDMRGTLDETFVGTWVPDRSHGTLNFHERFSIDGATSVLHIDTDVLGGDGDPSFRCSGGHVTFDGLTPGETGFGGYEGTWTHGCR